LCSDQTPYAGPRKGVFYLGEDHGALALLAVCDRQRFQLRFFQIDRAQRFEFSNWLRREAWLSRRDLDQVRERVFQLMQQGTDILRVLQSRANVGFESLQDIDINLSIEASRTPPIAGHAYVRKPKTIRLRFEQQQSDIHKFPSHYIGNIPQQAELELLQISHRHSNLELGISISKFAVQSAFCGRSNSSVLFPVRKWLSRARPKRHNEFAHLCPPIKQAADQFFERAPVAGIPLWRNTRSTVPYNVFVHSFYRREPWLKRFPPAHIQIHLVLGIYPSQRIIRERPFAGIEAISLINEGHRVLLLSHLPPERCLSAV